MSTVAKIDFGFGIAVKAPKLPPVRRAISNTTRAPRLAAPTTIVASTLRELAEGVVFAADNRLGLHEALVACSRAILAAPVPASVVVALPAPAKRARSVAKADDANGFAAWTDYEIKTKKLKNVGPTCVVTFADGETCRMSTAQPDGKPVNAGRGLRLCIAAWQSRQGEPAIAAVRARLPEAQEAGAGENKIEALEIELKKVAAERNARDRPPPPAVTSIHFERNGETVARFDPMDANNALAVAS